jgi:UDP-glucose 4-epimerase
MAFFLVTGGCGFIGSHLAHALVSDGHRVRVLDDLSSGNPSYLPRDATLVVGDIRDNEIVGQALEGVDGCFHLAAVVSVTLCEQRWEHAHEVNLTGALNVFRQANSGPKPVPVVYASSAAVYGDAQELPAREEMPPHPINAYGADKTACELHAAAIARATGGSLTGLRFFNVYGPRQDPASAYSGVVSIFCERLIKGEAVDIYGDGTQTRDFIHVSDVVQALLTAMERAPAGSRVFNVCTGKVHSLTALAKCVAKLCATRAEMRFHPARKGDIQHSKGDPTHAAAGLNFRARVSLSTGLRELIATLDPPSNLDAEPAKIAVR